VNKLLPGERVAHWRRIRGLSQGALADRIGMTRSSLCRKEKGKQGLAAEEIEQIVQALEISMGEFYGEDAQPGAAS
jgi:transcriptional regulator with XRE-family HTH domain